MKIKTGDNVILLTGKYEEKATAHKVIAVSPKEGKVIVEGANIVKKHVRPRSAQEQGGIVEILQQHHLHCRNPTMFCLL